MKKMAYKAWLTNYKDEFTIHSVSKVQITLFKKDVKSSMDTRDT